MSGSQSVHKTRFLALATLIWCFLPCHSGAHQLEPGQYFSQNYSQAREAFLAAAVGAGSQPEHYLHPEPGPDGSPLYTDLVWLGEQDASQILVISSGTHGVEGFAGSAIQTGLLSQGLADQIPGGTAVLMIHAINPFGFAHLRRFDSANVDVNRNFHDFTAALPDNPGYAKLHSVLSPPEISFWQTTRLAWALAGFYLGEGMTALSEAISGGQYQYPDGLFYGGQQASWSNDTLHQISSRYLMGAERVVVIDIHTGLGEFAEYSIIMNEPKASPSYQRALQIWGEKVETTSVESVSAHIAGPLKLAIPRMLPGSQVTAVSLEFGTYSRRQVLMALREENWLFHHGDPDEPKAAEIKESLVEAFYPDSPEWNREIWQQGREVVLQALEHIGR